MESKGWTEERVELLKRMTAEGFSLKEIGAALGVSVSTVCSARKKYSMLKNLKWNDDDDEQLQTMVNDGKSNYEIARKMKRTLKAIRQRRHILGINDMKKPQKIGYDECVANFKKRYNIT